MKISPIHYTKNITPIPYADMLEAQVQILAKVLLYALSHDRETIIEYVGALKDSLNYPTT